MTKQTGGFIITGDWHAHCWKDGGGSVLGINARLKDFLVAFQQMIGYAKEHKVEQIYVLGDIFHLKKNIPVQAFDQLWLHLWHTRNLKWDFLAGNHDREDDRYDSVTILPFGEIGRVYTQPTVDKERGIVYVPWMYNQADVLAFMKDLGKREYDLLLFHGEMEGALMGPTDYVMKSKVTAKSFGLARFARKFAGHIHKQQLIHGVHYPGSLIAKDFGEVEADKGFLHVTGETVTPVVVSYPKFMTYVLPLKPKDALVTTIVKTIPGQFVQVLSEQAVDPSVVKRFEQANPRILRFRLDRQARDIVVKAAAPTTDISWDGLVDGYVERKGCPPELHHAYVDYGLKVLRGA